MVLLESIAYIHNQPANPTNMDARRYDRNADQLAQILWNLRHLETRHNEEASKLKIEMRYLLDQALHINDKLGKMAEKGLI